MFATPQCRMRVASLQATSHNGGLSEREQTMYAEQPSIFTPPDMMLASSLQPALSLPVSPLSLQTFCMPQIISRQDYVDYHHGGGDDEGFLWEMHVSSSMGPTDSNPCELVGMLLFRGTFDGGTNQHALLKLLVAYLLPLFALRPHFAAIVSVNIGCIFTHVDDDCQREGFESDQCEPSQ
jgi:hypothetical protein